MICCHCCLNEAGRSAWICSKGIIGYANVVALQTPPPDFWYAQASAISICTSGLDHCRGGGCGVLDVERLTVKTPSVGLPQALALAELGRGRVVQPLGVLALGDVLYGVSVSISVT